MKKLPERLRNDDGELVAFDTDQISQALFRSTEALGKPNAFLARELTDSVLHFLVEELSEDIPTIPQITDVVTKVVRELGHPSLAIHFAQSSAFSSDGPKIFAEPQRSQNITIEYSADASADQWVRQCLRGYSFHTIFSSDLRSAHDEELLTICDLSLPNKLAGGYLSLRSMPAAAAIRSFGSFVVIDGPEFTVSTADSPDERAFLLAQFVKTVLQSTECHLVINLNRNPPPDWALELENKGPLFASEDTDANATHHQQFRQALLRFLSECPAEEDWRQGLRVDYHLRRNTHFEWSDAAGLVQQGCLRLVLDRTGKSIDFADGLQGSDPAVLCRVAIHLPRTLELPGVGGVAQNLLAKLPSLARMAVSVGVQKRRFLRLQENQEINRRFLLDRATLVVIPVGLDECVQHLEGVGIGEGTSGLELGQQILTVLRRELQLATARTNLEIRIDNAFGLWRGSASDFFLDASSVGEKRNAAGITMWNLQADIFHQMHDAGRLQKAADGGTAMIVVENPNEIKSELWNEVIKHGWSKTTIRRFYVVDVRRLRREC